MKVQFLTDMLLEALTKEELKEIILKLITYYFSHKKTKINNTHYIIETDYE